MEHAILGEIVILLMVSVLAVVAFRRFNLPPVLAYLFVGVLVGPHGWGWVSDTSNTRTLAEFGVVFLLFTVGLEFSLPQLIAMRREVLGLGGAQVGITAAIVALFAWAFEFNAAAAIIIGGTIAMSSTAIVIKQLAEQLELNSRHGRLSIGILLFQDLAVIPFLILIPALSGQADNSVALDLTIAFVKGAAVVAVMLALGHWLLRPLFHEIAKAHSSELFTLAVLLFSLAAAWLTDLSGLSLALGAFLAGMMVGETEFRHQVEADIRPFRDVLLGLFFVTIGMLLNVHTLPDIIHWVLLVLVGMTGLKIALIFAISRFSGAENGVALRTGLVLAQGGEFGFALIALAVGSNVMSLQSSQIVLAAIIFSMVLSPFLIKHNGAIAKRVFATSYRGDRERNIQQVAHRASELNEHVLICGYGRIGQNISRFLAQENFKYFALDLDPVRVREARQAGDNVTYGDASHRTILEAAGIMRARVLVISYDDYHSTLKIISQVREIRPEIPILVRTRDDANLERLQEIGATEVVPETLEASLMLSSYLLLLLGVPMRRVTRHVQNARNSRYTMLRQFFHGQEIADMSEPDAAREGLHSVTLVDGAFAVSKRIEELKLSECGVTVTAIRHGDQTSPPAEFMSPLQAGDVLVLYGKPEALEHGEAVLLKG